MDANTSFQDRIDLNPIKVSTEKKLDLTKRLQTCDKANDEIYFSGINPVPGSDPCLRKKDRTNNKCLLTGRRPSGPPRWWSLLQDYQFIHPDSCMGTTKNPPEWWSLQLPDDSLYEEIPSKWGNLCKDIIAGNTC